MLLNKLFTTLVFLLITCFTYAYPLLESTKSAHFAMDEGGVAMDLCSFTGIYGPSSYDPAIHSLTDYKIEETAGGYEIVFFYEPILNFNDPTNFSQRLFLNEAGQVTDEGSVITYSSSNLSQDFNSHYLSQSTGISNTFSVSKINSVTGNTTWSRNYTVPNGVNITGALATEIGNRIVLVGFSGFQPNRTKYVVVTDLNGNEIGQTLNSNPVSTNQYNLTQFETVVAQTPDGGFLLNALYPSRNGQIIKLSPTGAFVFGDEGEGDFVTAKYYFVGLAGDNTGYYTTAEGGSNNYAYVRKSDLNTGEIIWENSLRNAVNLVGDVNFQTLSGVVATPDGGVLASYTPSSPISSVTFGSYLVKYNSDGSVAWTRQPGIVLSSSTSDNGFFERSAAGNGNIELTKYNNLGEQLPLCDGPGDVCNVNITSTNGGVTITGLTSDANSKLFDGNISIVWGGCNIWQTPCSSTETVSGLSVGATYFLSVESSACSEWIPIVIQGGGSTATCSDGIQNQGETGVDCGGPCAPCNTGGCNVAITSANGGVSITGLSGDANSKLFTSSVQVVWGCNPWQGSPCSSNETVSGLTVGATYFLSVQSTTCDEWIPIVIQGNSGCPDSDQDGTCDEDDCQPNNPTRPAAPGTPCNDFNSNTTNDVIQSNGCSCEGSPIPGLCTVSYTSGTSGIFISGLTSDSNVKLFDSNTQVVFSCNPWQGSPCATDGQVISGLTFGETYFLSVQSANCNEWIPITIGGNNELPDLLPNSLTIGSGAPGTILPFSFNLVNQGGTVSGNYSIKTYISLDNQLSSDDIQEGTIITGNTPMGSTLVNGAITVPNIPPGTYYFFLIVDPDGAIIESNEFNNGSLGKPFVITNGGSACNPTNVAQGKPATQSSTLNFGGVNSGASNAVDGNTDGNYYNGSVAATNEESQAWWQVDLGGLYDLSSIEVYNRTEGTSRLNFFYIMTADSPYTSDNINIARSNSNNERFITGQAGTPTTWILAGDPPVRYVRIQRSSLGYVTLAEVRVNGCPVQNLIDDSQGFVSNETTTPVFSVQELFPNPTTGEVISRIDSKFEGDLEIEFINSIGQVVKVEKVDLEKGTNTFQLDLAHFENGMYNITFSNGKEIISKRIVKIE